MRDTNAREISGSDTPRSRLDVLEQWSKILAAIALPVAIGIATSVYTVVKDQASVRLEYVKLAVEVLKFDPSKNAPGLRDWSLAILDKYSGVPLSAQAKESLKSQPLLPVDPSSPEDRELMKRDQATANTAAASVTAWGNAHCPSDAVAKSSVTYSSEYGNRAYLVVECYRGAIQCGPTVQWWDSNPSRKKADGQFDNAGSSTGWWNFYDPNGSFIRAHCFVPGTSKPVRSDKERRHDSSERCG